MNDVTLDPDSVAVQAFILRAVDEHIDTPVAYAFSDGWPVTMSQLEAEEVYHAIEQVNPPLTAPHGEEHKELALKAVYDSRTRSSQE